jgi:L-lactate dehydrogenase complex protein LldG
MRKEMNLNGQEQFIAKVRTALGHAPHKRQSREAFFYSHDREKLHSPQTLEADRLLEHIENRGEAEREKLLNILVQAGKPLNLNVIPQKNISGVAALIAELVREKTPEWSNSKSVAAWKHPLLEKLHLPEILSEQNVPVFFTELKDESDRQTLHERVRDAFIGVTSADFCLAETGTLVMKTRPGLARSVSLLPTIHVAVIGRHQILANLKELYTVLTRDPGEKKEGLTNCMTFITGPSKTADIEATLVHGAHGPREVYIYVY